MAERSSPAVGCAWVAFGAFTGGLFGAILGAASVYGFLVARIGPMPKGNGHDVTGIVYIIYPFIGGVAGGIALSVVGAFVATLLVVRARRRDRPEEVAGPLPPIPPGPTGGLPANGPA